MSWPSVKNHCCKVHSQNGDANMDNCKWPYPTFSVYRISGLCLKRLSAFQKVSQISLCWLEPRALDYHCHIILSPWQSLKQINYFLKTGKLGHSTRYFLDNESLYRLEFRFLFTWDTVFETWASYRASGISSILRQWTTTSIWKNKASPKDEYYFLSLKISTL